jgi:hypothetical protein
MAAQEQEASWAGEMAEVDDYDAVFGGFHRAIGVASREDCSFGTGGRR